MDLKIIHPHPEVQLSPDLLQLRPDI